MSFVGPTESGVLIIYIGHMHQIEAAGQKGWQTLFTIILVYNKISSTDAMLLGTINIVKRWMQMTVGENCFKITTYFQRQIKLLFFYGRERVIVNSLPDIWRDTPYRKPFNVFIP